MNFKKICCMIATVAMIFGTFPLTSYGVGETYTNEFSNTDALNELTVKLRDGEVYSENGELFISGAIEYPPSTRVIFPFECESDFSLSVDVYVGEESGAAQTAVFFGGGNDGGEYKLILSQQDGKVELCAAYCVNEEEFTVLSRAQTVQEDVLGLEIIVSEGALYVSVDDVPVIECAAPYASSGAVGVEARAVTSSFDNVSIKNGMADTVKASDSYNTAVYVPATGIVSPPVVIEKDNAKNESYDINIKREAITVFEVKMSDGGLAVFSGTQMLGTLAERMELSKGLTVPAFSVSDAESAAALSAFLSDSGMKDGFVISAKDEYIKTVVDDNPLIRGVIDASSSIAVNTDDLYKKARSAGCNTVILPQRSVNADTVKALRAVFLTVYAVCGEKNTNSDIYTCLASGCDGIVGDADAVISYMESFTDMTHFGSAMNVSKGGDETVAHINSLSAVMSAAKGGADAIWVDVCITDDGHPVLSASDSTDYLNKNVSIYDTTLDELKKLHYTDDRISGQTVATLSEVLKHIKGTYPDLVLYAKLSDDRTATADAVGKVVSDHGMQSRVVIMTDKFEVARHVNNKADMGANCISKVYIPLNASENTAVYCIEASLREINSAYFAFDEKPTARFMYYALSRGITVVRDEARQVSALNIQKSDDGTVTVTAKRADGTVYDVTDKAELITVGGTPMFNGGRVTGDGVFAARVPFADGYVYTRGLTVEEKKAEPDETTAVSDDREADSNIMKYVIIACCTVMVAGGLVFFGFLKKTSFKAKEE